MKRLQARIRRDSNKAIEIIQGRHDKSLLKTVAVGKEGQNQLLAYWMRHKEKRRIKGHFQLAGFGKLGG